MTDGWAKNWDRAKDEWDDYVLLFSTRWKRASREKTFLRKLHILWGLELDVPRPLPRTLPYFNRACWALVGALIMWILL
jgi:hypothetical protein